MASLKELPIPDIGEFEGVPVIEILVAPGDTVAVEDPLVVLESDKATMEVPCAVAGTVKELKVAVGDQVSAGDPMIVVEVDADSDSAATDERGDAPAKRSPQLSVEDVTTEPTGLAKEAPQTDVSQTDVPQTDVPQTESGSQTVYASPSVRRRAREAGIDLASIAGSGPQGRITIEDLDRASASATVASGADGRGGGATSRANAAELDLAPWPEIDFAQFGAVERIALSRIQKLSGAYLARNWVRIPHVTHNEDADITETEKFRREVNLQQSEVKVTMVALLMKACSATLSRFATFNSSLDGEELVLKRYHHLGFAADTPRGLVVPVIRDVDTKGILALAGELTELSAKARAGKLSPSEMSGATFTISSLGGIGGTSFTPIINAPEVAVLGVVRAVTRPVWDGEGFVPRLILPLSLSYDHRVIDGASAARFCTHLASVLADMRRVLL